MLVHGTCCGCLSLRKECIVFGLVDLITQIPHIAVDVNVDGDIAFVDLIVVIIGTLLSGLLVYGAVLKNLFCLWLWIIVHIVRTLIFVVGLIFLVIALTTDAENNFISALVHEEFNEKEMIAPITVLTSMQIAVYIFLMVLVYRYIRELRDDEADDSEESDDDSTHSEKSHWWSEFIGKITKTKWTK